MSETGALFGDRRGEAIHHLLDMEVWSPVNKRLARQLLRLPDDAPIVPFGAMGGGRDTCKGYELLLRSLGHLAGCPEGRRIHLVIFGQREPKNPLSVGFPVSYMGNQSYDLSHRVLYSAADVMVVPSRLEAFGQTASGASACGTPVVAFGNSGIRDIVVHEESRYLAVACDVADPAHGISWVLRNRGAGAMGRKARALIVQRFGVPVIARRFKEAYANLLERGVGGC